MVIRVPRFVSRRVAGIVGVVFLAGACSATSPSTSPSTLSAGLPSAAPGRTLRIVAGENFWGSIVSQLAGQKGDVTSVLTDPGADPHNFESSATNARAFADADYVVLNGAGYDAWGNKLLDANPNPKRKVLTIADLLGKKEGDNPHFWYQPDYVAQAVDRVTADLKNMDAGDAAYFDAQRAALNAAFAPQRARLDAIKSHFSGTPVASTESIFVYLGDYLGLRVVSPTDFMNAIAEGNDPPAPSVARFHDLLTNKEAKVLVYNRQTSTEVTTNLQNLARGNGIGVVGVTETVVPPGTSFQAWFGAELLDLQNALNATVTGGG
ncbi:MAG: hypothetical protein QOF30_93 [Acidimicrobiaceae bacterium]|jgi:zinc/manganese transport system substrate-binding protein|nr:hypothetical protein [Acidimicrobiaceae bacterium]